MWVFWLIAAGVFFVIEMATIGFLVFWLGIGALLAMVTSFITDNIIIQFVVFLVSSTLLLIFTKPLVNKFIKIPKEVKTNAYSIIGKKGIVIAPINNIEGNGQIKIDGEVWSAKSYNDENIPKNSEVEIVEIDGVRAVVKLVSNVKEDSTVNV
jgi:membrane protein implicated in regulation of membrane protease activity